MLSSFWYDDALWFSTFDSQEFCGFSTCKYWWLWFKLIFTFFHHRLDTFEYWNENMDKQMTRWKCEYFTENWKKILFHFSVPTLLAYSAEELKRAMSITEILPREANSSTSCTVTMRAEKVFTSKSDRNCWQIQFRIFFLLALHEVTCWCEFIRSTLKMGEIIPHQFLMLAMPFVLHLRIKRFSSTFNSLTHRWCRSCCLLRDSQK